VRPTRSSCSRVGEVRRRFTGWRRPSAGPPVADCRQDTTGEQRRAGRTAPGTGAQAETHRSPDVTKSGSVRGTMANTRRRFFCRKSAALPPIYSATAIKNDISVPRAAIAYCSSVSRKLHLARQRYRQQQHEDRILHPLRIGNPVYTIVLSELIYLATERAIRGRHPAPSGAAVHRCESLRGRSPANLPLARLSTIWI
jgi:hypothetical protein